MATTFVTGTGKHFSKSRSRDYFNELLEKDTMKLLTKYAICPPNEVEGYQAKTVRAMDVSAYGRADNMRYARVTQDKKVAYIKLYKEPRVTIGGGGPINNEGGDVIKFQSSFANNGGTAVYFLPWDSGGAIIRLTIPPKGSNDPDPDIFFTAAINGCSIFVQGNPNNPTIYHAGGDTGKADPNDAASFWRTALTREVLRPAVTNRGQVMAEVNKTEYIKTPGVAGGTTARAAAYEALLNNQLNQTGKVTVSMVNPWGCVMGIRTGDNWSFYLQENATVVCDHITKAGTQRRYYARPMALKQIYPGGTTHMVNMRWTVPPRIS